MIVLLLATSLLQTSVGPKSPIVDLSRIGPFVGYDDLIHRTFVVA